LVLGNISPGSAEAGPSKPKNVTPTTSRGKITSFFDRMTPEEQERSSECLARAVYGTGLPFHTFENPLWIEAFKTLRPGFKPPNAKLLGGGGVMLDKKSSREEIAGLEKIINAQC